MPSATGTSSVTHVTSEPNIQTGQWRFNHPAAASATACCAGCQRTAEEAVQIIPCSSPTVDAVLLRRAAGLARGSVTARKDAAPAECGCCGRKVTSASRGSHLCMLLD